MQTKRWVMCHVDTGIGFAFSDLPLNRGEVEVDNMERFFAFGAIESAEENPEIRLELGQLDQVYWQANGEIERKR